MNPCLPSSLCHNRRGLAQERRSCRFAEMMAESGVELLQYRNKHATSSRTFRGFPIHLCAGCRELAQGRAAHQPRFIVNDRRRYRGPGERRRCARGADTIWVSTKRGPLWARRTLQQSCWVGVSTHSLEQVDAADKTSADYIAFGPVFPTSSKENPDPVVGLASAAGSARAHTRKPLVAIGGITLERAAETYRAGADSLAVARDLIVAENPAPACSCVSQ